jgi:hypothetical protein
MNEDIEIKAFYFNLRDCLITDFLFWLIGISVGTSLFILILFQGFENRDIWDYFICLVLSLLSTYTLYYKFRIETIGIKNNALYKGSPGFRETFPHLEEVAMVVVKQVVIHQGESSKVCNEVTYTFFDSSSKSFNCNIATVTPGTLFMDNYFQNNNFSRHTLIERGKWDFELPSVIAMWLSDQEEKNLVTMKNVEFIQSLTSNSGIDGL